MTVMLVCNPRRPEGVPQAERVVPPASELMPDLHALLRVALVEADDGLVRRPAGNRAHCSLYDDPERGDLRTGRPTCPYRVLRVVGLPALPGTVSA